MTHRLPLLGFLACLFLVKFCFGAAAPAHPSLLLSSEGVAQLKARIASSPTFKARFDEIKARVDRSLKQAVVLPPRGSNWYHWYICPKHGNQLRQGKQIGPYQWEHICPVGGEVYRGDPAKPETDYDGYCLAGIHSGYAQLIRDAGLVYQATGDARYAAKARDVLLAYANQYLKYPLHTIRNEPKIGGGRVGPQTLDESVWLIPVCQGADLVWDTLSADDQKTIADKLLLPAARDVILPHKMGIHNIQCWKNSAVGLVGFLLGDKQLIAAAIDDPIRGYRMQMAKGVQADGQWWEGSWGYHFYMVNAVLPLVEAARNHGIDLYGPELKRLFDAPLKLAMPDHILPDFNDSPKINLRSSASVYELAYARYKDPMYLTLLDGSARRDNYALLFGVDPLPKVASPAVASANYPASGYAILTAGPADRPTWLCLKYGPHGGGHGHPDKLNFILYAHNQIVAPDAGITAYGSPLHQGWFRTTLGHNTLTIDEKNQDATQGECIAFGNEGGVECAVLDAGKIGKGVQFDRTAALIGPDLVVFVDQIRSSTPHTYDIAYHQRGAWANLPQGEAWTLPQANGYRYFADATSRSTAEAMVLNLNSGGEKAAFAVAGGESTQVITATGPGASTADRVPVVLLRRKAADATLAWCVALDGKAPALRLLPTSSPQTAAVEVKIDGKTMYLLANPSKKNATVTMPDGSRWESAAAFGVR